MEVISTMKQSFVNLIVEHSHLYLIQPTLVFKVLAFTQTLVKRNSPPKPGFLRNPKLTQALVTFGQVPTLLLTRSPAIRPMADQ